MKYLLILLLFFLKTEHILAQKSHKTLHKKTKMKSTKCIFPPVVPDSLEPISSQGIKGKVIWKSGNLMPSPDRTEVVGTPIVRELYVYELTNISQTVSEGSFYKTIKTKFIKKVKSEIDGEFVVFLPEGNYSLFVKEGEKGFYANSFDGEGNIFPVKVEKNKLQTVEFVISYEARY